MVETTDMEVEARRANEVRPISLPERSRRSSTPAADLPPGSSGGVDGSYGGDRAQGVEMRLDAMTAAAAHA